ncbi:MAG: trypsin-like peptidase domain-containing protein, partial [Methylococcales bacterium]
MRLVWKDFVVGIDDQNDKPIGTGFLVAPNYVLTCTHVVATALAKDTTDPVSVDDEIIAKLYQQDGHPKLHIKVSKMVPVLPYQDRKPETLADITVLKIVKPGDFKMPKVKLLDVEHQIALSNQPFFAWGYHVETGQRLEGLIEPEDANGLAHLTFTKNPGKLNGASGAPIWSESAQAVVGMLVEANENNKRAYMIPASHLKQLCPEWGEYNAESVIADIENIPEPPKLPDLEAGKTFSALIKDNIAQILFAHTDLRDALATCLSLSNPTSLEQRVAERLCELPAHNAIGRTLHDAVVPVYSGFLAQTNHHAAKQLNIATLSLMGWLALTVLKEEELSKITRDESCTRGLLLSLQTSDVFEAELLVASKFLRPLEAKSGKNLRKVDAKHAIDISDHWRNWDEKDRVKDLAIQLWIKLFPGQTKLEIDTNDLELLNEELRQRRERTVDTEHHYVLAIESENELLSDDQYQQQYQQLFSSLHELTAVRLAVSKTHNY